MIVKSVLIAFLSEKQNWFIVENRIISVIGIILKDHITISILKFHHQKKVFLKVTTSFITESVFESN